LFLAEIVDEKLFMACIFFLRIFYFCFKICSLHVLYNAEVSGCINFPRPIMFHKHSSAANLNPSCSYTSFMDI
jgi:hypothetical protein